MSIPGICRVCLRTDRRLSAINNTVLQETLERLTSTRSTDGKRLLVCYICRAQLMRSYQLMKRALDAEAKRSQNVVPLSLAQGLDYNFVTKLAQPIECRKIKRKTLKEIKEEKEIHKEEEDNINFDEESIINIKKENDINIKQVTEGSHQGQILGRINTDYGKHSGNNTLLKNKSMKEEILRKEVRIILQKIDVGLSSKTRKFDEISSKATQITVDATNKKKRFASNSFKKLDVYSKVNNVNLKSSILPVDEIQTKSVMLINEKTLRSPLYDYSKNEYNNQFIFKSSNSVAPASLSSDRHEIKKSDITGKNGSQNEFVCQTCQYICDEKCKLNIHFRKHHGDKPYICDLCNYRATQKSLLIRHMLLKHIKVKNFSCHICRFKFVAKREPNKHIREHTGKYLHICNFCKCKFSRKSHLTNHVKYIHTKEKTFSCHICNFKCVTNSDLKKHLKKHTGEKPFICDMCDYKSTRKGHLEVHIKYKHTKEKNFSCHICDTKYVIKSDLNKHLLKHSREKPFACSFCDYRSSQKGTLTTHMKKHLDENNFSCHICRYKCVSKGNLNKHLRKHTAKEANVCEICDSECSSKSNLNSHIISKHTT